MAWTTAQGCPASRSSVTARAAAVSKGSIASYVHRPGTHAGAPHRVRPRRTICSSSAQDSAAQVLRIRHPGPARRMVVRDGAACPFEVVSWRRSSSWRPPHRWLCWPPSPSGRGVHERWQAHPRVAFAFRMDFFGMSTTSAQAGGSSAEPVPASGLQVRRGSAEVTGWRPQRPLTPESDEAPDHAVRGFAGPIGLRRPACRVTGGCGPVSRVVGGADLRSGCDTRATVFAGLARTR